MEKVMRIKNNKSDKDPVEFLQINSTGIACLRDHKEIHDDKVDVLRIIRENGRNDWQIMFVIGGTLEINVQDDVLLAKENDVCIFPPKIRNDYVFKVNKEGKNTAAYYIHYTGTAINDIMSKTGINKIAVLRNMPIEMRRQFEWVLKYHKQHEDYSAIGTLLLILSALDDKKTSEPSDFRRRIHNVADYMALHYTEDIDIDACAELCNMSRSRFSHLFKEEFGVPPHNYMINLRIEHSVELLWYSSLSISEVALQCGITDAYYFTRLFTKKYGMSPSKFRAKKREYK